MIVTNKDSDGKGSAGGINTYFDYIIFFNPSQLNYLVDNNQLIYSGENYMENGTKRFFNISNYTDYKCFVMPYLKKNTLSPIDNIALYIKDDNGFNAYGLYKDGRGGQDGGGNYNDHFFWIAIHNNINYYKTNGFPIIEVGDSETINGSVIVNHNLNIDNYFILLTPICPSNHINNFYYNLQYHSKEPGYFTVISFERDGTHGQHGGSNIKNHRFNWAVIRNI